MSLAKEGWREMLLAALVLAGVGWAVSLLHPLAVIPIALVWAWVIAFFRDPRRVGRFAAGEMCAPADGTVTEVVRLPEHDLLAGPVIRIGIFLSIFNVHINRAPCAGVVRDVRYTPGKFLDARHPDSGPLNEANALIIDRSTPGAGACAVRQVAGLIARRIICHARAGTRLERGERFGLIKFGSRTELIVPDRGDVDICVQPGDKVRAGLTVMLRARAAATAEITDRERSHEGGSESTAVATG